MMLVASQLTKVIQTFNDELKRILKESTNDMIDSDKFM